MNEQVKIPESALPRVVIVGGGFGGINLSKLLVKQPFQVVLVDRNNYHTFQPLLYQVATAGLEPDSIAEPLRKLLSRHKNFVFRYGNVERIVPENKCIETSTGSIDYDFLIIANGSKTNYFGNEEIFKNAFPLKQVPQALDLRSHILQNFEKAAIAKNKSEVLRLMNFVIVGGGPTGVEVAGALGELKKHVLPRDYPELNLDEMQIHLIEGSGRLLNGMSDYAGKKALDYVKNFDVHVQLGKLVSSYDGEVVRLNDGSIITSNTLVWAAGVTGNMIEGLPDKAQRNGRLLVNRVNQVEGVDNIYAIGDIALMPTETYPNGHPMLAQVAIQQGKLLGQNLSKIVNNKATIDFEYRDLGSMATVGRNKAVVDLSKTIKFGGLIAWAFWMFIHLFSIMGFRGKLIVFINWIWNYFTYDRGTRLIIRKFDPKSRKNAELKKSA